MIDIELLNHLESFLTPRRRTLNTKVLEQRTNFISVAVADVYHLHNTSAVMRSCDIFGIQNMHIIEEVNRKKIDREIALGAQKWVDINRYESDISCMKTLRQKGYQIVATTPHEGSQYMEDFELDRPSVFFFGREKDGLSSALIEQADIRLKIPMVGFTESLNISVSAAIILQHFTSKLKNSVHPWQLTADQKLEKRMDWVKKVLKSHELLTARFYKDKARG